MNDSLRPGLVIAAYGRHCLVETETEGEFSLIWSRPNGRRGD